MRRKPSILYRVMQIINKHFYLNNTTNLIIREKSVTLQTRHSKVVIQLIDLLYEPHELYGRTQII